MPILRVVSNQSLSEGTVARLKALGPLINYSDPRKIWVQEETGLRQDDVAFVEVLAKYNDYALGNFPKFCERIGEILRQDLGKSVEVFVPSDGGIDPQAWVPTPEGAEIYKD